MKNVYQYYFFQSSFVLYIKKTKMKPKDYLKRSNEIKGATLSLSSDYSEVNKRHLSNPNDGTVGVIILNDKKNFVIMNLFDITDDEMLLVSKAENNSLSKLEYGA